jgi:hypothetical protein
MAISGHILAMAMGMIMNKSIYKNLQGVKSAGVDLQVARVRLTHWKSPRLEAKE